MGHLRLLVPVMGTINDSIRPTLKPYMQYASQNLYDHEIIRQKVKLSLCLTNSALRNEDVWGSGCIYPHFLDLDTSWRWVVSFTPLPLYPRERAPGTHFIGGWVEPRAGMDDMEKWKYFTLPGLEVPPPLVVQPVASRYTDWAIPAYSMKI
jgi:hypothetical protein